MEKINAQQQRTLADIIRHEGIKAKGFGTIPKFIMHDKDLSLESKAIYGYLSSLCGNGEATFPSRSRILSALNLSKNGYYSHYNALIDQGYIKVSKSNPKDIKSHNIYTIVAYPKKVEEFANKNNDNRVISNSIDSYGYGILPKAVMMDERLDIKAKGIYCYFASYAGAGDTAFPEKKNILYHLKLSEKTYYKYYNELIYFNYVIPIQRRNRGDFGVCDYILNQKPDEAIGSALQQSRRNYYRNIEMAISRKEDTANSQEETGVSKKEDTSKPLETPVKSAFCDTFTDSGVSRNRDSTKGDSTKGDDTKGDTTINSSPINNSFTNSFIYQSDPEIPTSYQSQTESTSSIDLIDKKIPEFISNKDSFQANPEPLTSNNIPTNEKVSSNYNPAEPVIQNDFNDSLEIQRLSKEEVADRISLNELREQCKDNIPEVEMLYEAMCNVLCDPLTDFIRINKTNTPISKAFPQFLSINNTHIRYVLTCLNNNDNKLKIKNPASIGNYLLTSLFHAPRTIGYYPNKDFSKPIVKKSSGTDWESLIKKQQESRTNIRKEREATGLDLPDPYDYEPGFFDNNDCP